MKNKYTKNKTHKTNRNTTSGSTIPWNESGFDGLANQIDKISRRRLPDGVMGGLLAGKEAEIRQDAAIMLLKGFLFGHLDFLDATQRKDQEAATYHLERVILIVLAICKSRLKRRRVKEQAREVEITAHNAGSCPHPVELDYWDLPLAIRTEMKQASLRLGVASGEISISNESLINMVIDEQKSAQQIADCLGITRSEVYQRFVPVRKILLKLMAKIEVPMS